MKKRLCKAGLVFTLCAFMGGCQTLDAVGGILIGKVHQAAKQRAEQAAEQAKVEALRGIIRQEITGFLQWLLDQGLLLNRTDFMDWTPRDLGPVDEETGLLLPKTVLPPLYERPQDIPEDIVKELHNATTHTDCRSGTSRARESTQEEEGNEGDAGLRLW